MGVVITNRRTLEATHGDMLDVGQLKHLIANLADNQVIEVKVVEGYRGGQLDTSPAKVELVINNPQVVAQAGPHYPPGARGGYDAGEAGVRGGQFGDH